MFNIVRFTRDEEGAVTVDWVVLTAAIVGIAIAVAATIQIGLNNASSTVADGVLAAVGGGSGGSGGSGENGDTFDCTATIVNGTATLVGEDC